jgi:PKD repeat protein
MVGTLQTFKYRIIDGSISDATVKAAIAAAGIPDIVKFVNTPNLQYQYYSANNFSYPVPLNPFEIIIFDSYALSHSHPPNPADIWWSIGVSGKMSISIERGSLTSEALQVQGNRIWKEISIAMGMPVDTFGYKNPQSIVDFCAFAYYDKVWNFWSYPDVTRICYNKQYCQQNPNSNMCSGILWKPGVWRAIYTSYWSKYGLFKPIVASFNASKISTFTGTPIAFTNTAIAFEKSGYPLTFAWDFGDGGTSNYSNPTHTYTNLGTYKVKLTVSSFFGSVSSEETLIEIKQLPVFRANWKYRIVGNVSQQRVKDAISAAQIPSTVTFTYDPNMPIIYTDPWNAGKPWPFPAESVNNGLVIVDQSTIPNINYGGLAYPDSGRCVTAQWESDSNETLGLRIWHEITHAMGPNVDGLVCGSDIDPIYYPNFSSDCDRFCNYASSDVKWKDDVEIKRFCANISNPHPYLNVTNMVLRAYYTMLWKEAGFPLVPAYVNINVNITAINNYTANKPMAGVKVYISTVLGIKAGITNSVGKLTMNVACVFPSVIKTQTPLGTVKTFTFSNQSCSYGGYNWVLPVGN